MLCEAQKFATFSYYNAIMRGSNKHFLLLWSEIRIRGCE